jgi:CHAT domain-containing protein
LRAAKFVAFGLLVISLAGPGFPSAYKLKAISQNRLPDESTASIWQAQNAKGVALYKAGRYSEAAKEFDQVAVAARERDPKASAHALGLVGAMQFAMHQYRPALNSLLSARSTAESAGDASEVAILDVNLASLCTEMGDLDEAAHWIQGTLLRISGGDRKNHLSEVEIQFATVRARQNRMPEALVWFRRGIEAAARAGDWNLYAIGWNRIGEEYLKRGNLRSAEAPLLEAYRVRKLRDLPLDTSYRNLGRLRLEQGDFASASFLFDRAIELGFQTNGPIPAWDAYHYRGRLRLAQGRIEDALADLRIAVRLARAWRWSAPSDDAMRIGAEGWLDRVYSALIEAGNQLYLKTGDTALVRETFEAAEENRANSLRTLVEERKDVAAALPAAYWAALQELQRAEVMALRTPTPASEEHVSNARAHVAQIQASSASEPPPATENLLRRARAGLDRDSAIVSFHLGDRSSWMWAVDADGIAVYRLPARDQLKPLIEASAAAIRDGAGASTAGAALYQALFGPLAPRFVHKSNWLLALDDELFEVPFAALPIPPDEPSSKGGFLVERRLTEIIPSVAFWLARSNPAESGADASLFLGVGDPIYNSADPRLPKSARDSNRHSSPFDLFAALPPPLPRLVASAAELEACARAWHGSHVLLEGASASRSSIEQQFGRHPVVVHFATHFLPSAEAEPQGMIALSLTDSGAADVLRPAEIARWHSGAELVVLSGCNSAAGAALPGTGLLGLNRAWLAAGAQNVISSHWAVPDESGSLFVSLYRNLSAYRLSAAQALRAAQLEMLRTGGWRARPEYWGAYFAMGKESK